jgi:excisionase family DNA binding protein
MITVPEVSALLKLSDQTVWRYIKDGKLPGRKVGRQYLVPVDAVEAMIEPLVADAPKGAEANE